MSKNSGSSHVINYNCNQININPNSYYNFTNVENNPAHAFRTGGISAIGGAGALLVFGSTTAIVLNIFNLPKKAAIIVLPVLVGGVIVLGELAYGDYYSKNPNASITGLPLYSLNKYKDIFINEAFYDSCRFTFDYTVSVLGKKASMLSEKLSNYLPSFLVDAPQLNIAQNNQRDL